MEDSEKIAAVDRWLEDVAAASRRWKSARAAQQASERVVAYLEEVRSRVHGVPPDLESRMDEAIDRNRANAGRLADAANEQSELECGFYDVVLAVRPPEVGEAWRMRCMEGKTWLRCSMELHYNRQHLERLSARAKVDAYDLLPERYKGARDA